MVRWEVETKESSEIHGPASLMYKQAMSKQQERDPVPNKWEGKDQHGKLSSGLNTCAAAHAHLHSDTYTPAHTSYKLIPHACIHICINKLRFQKSEIFVTV